MANHHQLSEEARRKISIARRKYFTNGGIHPFTGKPAPNKGIPHTEETKKKISEACKKAGVGKWNAGIIRPAEHRRHMSEAQLRYYQNKQEKKLLTGFQFQEPQQEEMEVLLNVFTR